MNFIGKMGPSANTKRIMVSLAEKEAVANEFFKKCTS